MENLSNDLSYKETGLRSVITEFALELTSLKDDYWHSSGTAIIIGPHLAITTKHVIEDYWRTFEQKRLKNNINGTFSIQAFQGIDEGKDGALWDVTKVWLSPFTDIAFLRLTPASANAFSYTWRIPVMNLMPPQVGSRIAGFGYHSPQITIMASDNINEVHWRSSPTTTIGKVIEIHERRRDAGMLMFPCFRVDARFDGGMSGGPIFNEIGQLCGIICSSFPPIEGETENVSFVTSLWPSMGTMIDLDREGLQAGTYYPVLELAKQKVIRAVNWERIILIKDSSGAIQQVGLRK
jgi:hypothetical protein